MNKIIEPFTFSVFVIFFFLFVFVFYIPHIYAISPSFSRTITQDRTDDVMVLQENLANDTELPSIKSLVNVETTSVSSNGTHLEIKLFSENLPSKVFQFLGNSSSNEFFLNILINSDGDIDTGFLGYDYRYLITQNGSKMIENKKMDSQSISPVIGKSLNDYGLISDHEYQNSSTQNEFEFTESFDTFNWTVSGYEIIDYNYEPLFFTSIADYKYLSFIPDGVEAVIDLKQMNYPNKYSLLIQLGAKSEHYKITDTFGQLYFPTPDISLADNVINLSPGKHSDILAFNNTGKYDLYADVNISNKTYPEKIKITFPQGNKFDLFGASGSIPIDFSIDPKIEFKNYIVPLNMSFSVPDPLSLDYNKSSPLVQVYNYSKILYLSLNVQKATPFLFSFPEIPANYMAIMLTAIFSIFIPSVSRQINDHNKKRIASKYLKTIYKNYDENNTSQSIDKVKNTIEIIKHEFVRGRITKDQYTILNEKFYDMLKDLMNRKNDSDNPEQN